MLHCGNEMKMLLRTYVASKCRKFNFNDNRNSELKEKHRIGNKNKSASSSYKHARARFSQTYTYWNVFTVIYQRAHTLNRMLVCFCFYCFHREWQWHLKPSNLSGESQRKRTKSSDFHFFFFICKRVWVFAKLYFLNHKFSLDYSGRINSSSHLVVAVCCLCTMMRFCAFTKVYNIHT